MKNLTWQRVMDIGSEVAACVSSGLMIAFMLVLVMCMVEPELIPLSTMVSVGFFLTFAGGWWLGAGSDKDRRGYPSAKGMGDGPVKKTGGGHHDERFIGSAHGVPR